MELPSSALFDLVSYLAELDGWTNYITTEVLWVTNYPNPHGTDPDWYINEMENYGQTTNVILRLIDDGTVGRVIRELIGKSK